jgi:putative effector of murein hydrolase
MKKFYGILCVLGIVLPYWQFLSWIAENGLAIDALIAEAVSSRISAFAWLDVIISAVVLFGFIVYEGSRIKMKRLWLAILGTCVVGVSLGLPLFLLLREMHLAKEPNP